MGEADLEECSEVNGASRYFTELEGAIEAISSSSLVRRRFRGRKVVELLADEGAMLVAGGASLS